MTESAVLELPGMPGPAVLERVELDGKCLVRRGRMVLFVYDADDVGMRNLAVVAVTDAGVTGLEAARVFGLTPQYVSMLRGRARKEGSAGLVKAMGRPSKLTGRQIEQARRWAGEGWTQEQIAARLDIHRSQIGLLIARRGVIAPQLSLPGEGFDTPRISQAERPEAATGPAPQPEPDVAEGRIRPGPVRSRYAGAMLGHAFLSRIGAPDTFSSLRTATLRRADDAALLTAVTLAFGLGISCLEGAKVLNRTEAGALAGLSCLPELRTLRPQLAQIADGCDPLAVQRKLATAMLAADAPALGVYYVDDHFVPYSGVKPVGRGFNNKRKQAQRGHGDTLVTDHRGRAVAFLTGEPSGLTKTLPDALEQLRQITGPDAKLMLGFDRGGAYACVFKVCRAFEVEWITYRRGKLKTTLIKPTAHPYPPAEAEAEAVGREVVHLSDEMVEFKDYGVCRQLTLFEDGVVKLQVLTSDMSADAASLLSWLRSRWRIENAIKDLSRLYGIDWLCDYRHEEIDDTTEIDNPARAAALAHLKDREKELATAERALARLIESPERPVAAINKKIPAARRAVDKATLARDAAKQAHKSVPAKIAVNELRPGQRRALPSIQRRTFQMVLRMLAYNSELFLADRLNAYLRDDNEYRALTRSLFQLHGDLDYQPDTITVTLDAPDSPRLTRALTLLTDEINQTPPHLPGDLRPITYKINIQQ